MSGYPLAVPLVTESHRIRIRCNHTMVIRGEEEKGEAISKRDRFSVALYATKERSPELWSNNQVNWMVCKIRPN